MLIMIGLDLWFLLLHLQCGRKKWIVPLEEFRQKHTLQIKLREFLCSYLYVKGDSSLPDL